MAITRYTVTDRRTMLSPWFGGTAENGWRDSRRAEYDSPFCEESAVVAAHKRGETVRGYEVTTTTYAVGTTADISWREVRVMSDVYEVLPHVLYRDDAGEWQTVVVATYADVVVDDPTGLAEYTALCRAREAARDAECRARAAVEERAEPARGKFVVVARGRKCPIGTVGRVFWTGESGGMYPTWKCGIAASTRMETVNGRERAADAVFVATSNCDVLLQDTPDDPRALALLYCFAAGVAQHLGEGVAESFPAAWSAACAEPWRLVVMLTYAPDELPKVDAKTPRTLADVCDVVNGYGDAVSALCLVAEECVAVYVRSHGAEDVSEMKAHARRIIESTLGVVYTPKARKPRAPKAAKTDALSA